tara:strand:- start:336 stop:1157 length:822 start_codon:yes stop_codon:yes gene_type:complete
MLTLTNQQFNGNTASVNYSSDTTITFSQLQMCYPNDGGCPPGYTVPFNITGLSGTATGTVTQDLSNNTFDHWDFKFWFINSGGDQTIVHLSVPTPFQGLMGDVNNDGMVNIVDVVQTVNAVLGSPAPGFNQALADMNQDGTVNIVDVVLLVDQLLNPQQAAQVNNRIRQMGRNGNGYGRRGNVRNNLNARPGQYRNQRTGRPYSGPMHTHNGRAMVGRRHTSTPHDYLTRTNGGNGGNGGQVNRSNPLLNSNDGVKMIKTAQGNKYVKTRNKR